MLNHDEYTSVISYTNRGVIESNIDYVNENESFICLAKIEFFIDLQDAYTFKDIMGYLHSKTDFGAVLIDEMGSIMLLFRDYKIHQAKAALQKITRSVLQVFGIEIKIIAITLIDGDDDYKSLLARLDQYYVMSKISTNKKIFYGTKHFNFYEGGDNIEILQNLFKKINLIKIHNLYKGVPIVEKIAILAFNKGELLVKINKNKIPFYNNEEFCFLEHDLIPNIIQANISKINPTLSTISLVDLKFLDNSPVERSGIRVEPDRNIYATLSHESKDICKGYIINISENSIVLNISDTSLKNLTKESIKNNFLTLKCQIPTKKSFITTIKTKASIFSIQNNEVVVNIYPNPASKTKLRSYISLRQTEVLLDLKLKLKS